MEEEAIRDHFLIQLNGYYEGAATGETFNGSGKTDILIRVGDRNAFIAECKFWRGQKQFSEGVDHSKTYVRGRDDMKVLYSGASFCDEDTAKRLFVIADEVAFMDRPSVTFHNWGMVGHDTQARRYSSEGSPVRISAYAPPSGPAEYLHTPYIECDVRNQEFIRTFLEGLRRSERFAKKFIQLEANYGEGKGHEIRRALIDDPTLASAKLDLDVQGRDLFSIATPQSRLATLKTLVIEASIQVTTSLVVAEDTEIAPVTDDPYFAKLLSLRTSISAYVGETARMAPYLGLAVARTVIPDEVLQKLSLGDVIRYRRATSEVYEAWAAEVNRLASEITLLEGANVEDEVKRVLAGNVVPQMVEYRREMEAVRDDLFSDLLKEVVKWEFPTLSVAYLTSLGIAASITAFAAALLPSVPHVVEYFQGRRDAKRRHAVSYLIELAEK